MPSLRARPEDIPLLLNELISIMESEKRRSVRFNSAAIHALCCYDWPGNVRELANLIERMAILYPHGIVGIGDLPQKFQQQADASAAPLFSTAEVSAMAAAASVVPLQKNVGQQISTPPQSASDLLPLNGIDLKEYLANLEKDLIEKALADSGGVVARAADRLQLGRTTLVEKMRKYNLQKVQEDGVEDTAKSKVESGQESEPDSEDELNIEPKAKQNSANQQTDLAGDDSSNAIKKNKTASS